MELLNTSQPRLVCHQNGGKTVTKFESKIHLEEALNVICDVARCQGGKRNDCNVAKCQGGKSKDCDVAKCQGEKRKDCTDVAKCNFVGIGHRVVHGGTHFDKPTLIDTNVKEKIRDLFNLATLHNPVNLLGIEFMEKIFPVLFHSRLNTYSAYWLELQCLSR